MPNLAMSTTPIPFISIAGFGGHGEDPEGEAAKHGPAVPVPGEEHLAGGDYSGPFLSFFFFFLRGAGWGGAWGVGVVVGLCVCVCVFIGGGGEVEARVGGMEGFSGGLEVKQFGGLVGASRQAGKQASRQAGNKSTKQAQGGRGGGGEG